MPHSDIPGSKPAGGSPGLIAAIHVLHRLLVPRHPPCALASSASRSLDLTKPAGSTFSKRPNSRKKNLSICSTTLQFFRCSLIKPERAQKMARRPSSHSGHGKSSATLCGWRLQLTDDSSLLGSSRTHAPGNRQCARPANIHYIWLPFTRASEFVLAPRGRWSRGDSNP